ncbi:MAG: quinone oxidoreductase [Rhodospirillaceae bacterium]|nr:quinone oxidoreductase [Rhodospirillaceae bacterium]|tara:strand:+ start:934 stop:1908 length:975 start_codon:yes stop_codon:yes gene_type:complete
MTHAIRIHEHGGPDVLRWEEVDVDVPGPGEVRLRQTAAGLNFLDVYHRNGAYKLPQLPTALGMEAAGVVEEVGEGVDDLKLGDRVAYAGYMPGAYAEERIMPAERLVPLPDFIDDQQAAAMMLQGMTVEYLISRTFPVQAGQTVLFHAIAGGVGLIACQWLKQLGALVIGTAGSDEKAELAHSHGCDHVIVYGRENIVERVNEITDGAGVPVVYDSVGKDTWDASIESLQSRGTMVSFGAASGVPDDFSVNQLQFKGSLYVTRPTLLHYIANRSDLLGSANALFNAVENGLTVDINQTFSLEATAEAHRALEARETTGSTVLLP